MVVGTLVVKDVCISAGSVTFILEHSEVWAQVVLVVWAWVDTEDCIMVVEATESGRLEAFSVLKVDILGISGWWSYAECKLTKGGDDLSCTAEDDCGGT